VTAFHKPPLNNEKSKRHENECKKFSDKVALGVEPVSAASEAKKSQPNKRKPL